MRSISDPSRPSRRDRRRAQKVIDTAFAERQLTAADRALRTQRIAAAHTRGDLAMITRDVLAPTTASLGTALDPATLSSMRAGSGRRPASTSAPGALTPRLPSGATIDLTKIQRTVRLIVIISVVSFAGLCLLGMLAAIVPAVVGLFSETVQSSSTPPDVARRTTPPPERNGSTGKPAADTSLLSASGWRSFVEDIEKESGNTSVYDVVVYPTYASVGLDGNGAVERRFYRDGAWDSSVSVRTPAVGKPFDLSEIEAGLIARLPAETAEHFGIEAPTGTYLIINAIMSEPSISVYVQSDTASQYRRYTLDGQPLT